MTSLLKCDLLSLVKEFFYIVQHQEVGVINYIQVHEKSYIYKRDPNISTTM